MTKDTIKKAALELFQRYSYVKTSVSDIAAAAGIGKGTIYLSFRTKEDILFSLLDDEMTAIKAASDPVYLDPQVTLEEKLELFGRQILDVHFRIRDIMFGSLENVHGRELRDVYLKFTNYIDRVADFLVEVLALHGHPATEDSFEAVSDYLLFLCGRIIVYTLSHDWNNREEIYRLMPRWARRIFHTLIP